MGTVYHLTADELLEMLDAFGEITVLKEGPRSGTMRGTYLWPSFVADCIEDGKHVEAIVQMFEDYNVILVSPRLGELLA